MEGVAEVRGEGAWADQACQSEEAENNMVMIGDIIISICHQLCNHLDPIEVLESP